MIVKVSWQSSIVEYLAAKGLDVFLEVTVQQKQSRIDRFINYVYLHLPSHKQVLMQ